MIRRSLNEIQIMCGGFGLKEKYNNLKIQGISTDSRDISNEKLFIPLIGENFNGHNFIEDVIGKNAKAALWNKDEPIPDVDFPFILVEDTLLALQELARSYCKEVNPKVIGITGSNGKTSTKDILASLLERQYKTHKTKGNFNNGVGVPLTLLEMDEDTQMAVIEMGMDNFGQIELLTTIAPPDAAVITNIGEAHLDDLILPENIAKAKLEIIKGMKNDGLFLYYGDDSILKNQVEKMSIVPEVKSYGKEDFNHYQPVLVSIDEKGNNFYLKQPKSPEFFLPMLGKHQMLNATAAIGLARHFNISFDDIKLGLLKVNKTGMRNELVQAHGFTILDDSYKSNPGAVLAALDTLYMFDNYDQKIVVLGDMLGIGQDEINMHKDIGQKIDKDKVDYLFTIGDLGYYISRTAKENLGENRVLHCENKSSLVEEIKKIIVPNALVLVKASRPLAMEEVVKMLKEKIDLDLDKS